MRLTMLQPIERQGENIDPIIRLFILRHTVLGIGVECVRQLRKIQVQRQTVLARIHLRDGGSRVSTLSRRIYLSKIVLGKMDLSYELRMGEFQRQHMAFAKVDGNSRGFRK